MRDMKGARYCNESGSHVRVCACVCEVCVCEVVRVCVDMCVWK